MTTRLPVLMATLACLGGAPRRWQATLDDAAVHARPQNYLMDLPTASAGEIAEAVLGEAPGLPFQVDPRSRPSLVPDRRPLFAASLARELAARFGMQAWLSSRRRPMACG